MFNNWVLKLIAPFDFSRQQLLEVELKTGPVATVELGEYQFVSYNLANLFITARQIVHLIR